MSAIRDLGRLHPELAWRFSRVVLYAEGLGHPIRVTETIRLLARQEDLYAQGRTKPGLIVTQALPGTSKHTPCLLDGTPNDPNGLSRAVDWFFEAPDPWGLHHPWALIGAIGENLGLVWGGRWENPRDLGHFEWRVGT